MTPWDGQPRFEGEIPKPAAARVLRGPTGRMRRVKPDQVVVNRADLEAVLAVLPVIAPGSSPQWEWEARLRAVLDEDGRS